MIWRCSPHLIIERKFKSINRHFFFTRNLLINLNLINLFFNFSLLTVYSKNKIIERSRVDQEKFFRGRGVLKFLSKGPIFYRGWWGPKICIQTCSKNSNILKFKERIYTFGLCEGICMILTLLFQLHVSTHIACCVLFPPS